MSSSLFTGNYFILQVSTSLLIFGLFITYKAIIKKNLPPKTTEKNRSFLTSKNVFLSHLDSLANLFGVARKVIIVNLFVKVITCFIILLLVIKSFNFSTSRAILSILIASGLFLYWLFGHRDRSIKKYRESFELEFGEFVDSLALAVNSGLAVTSGLFRVIEDYLQETERVKPLNQQLRSSTKVLKVVMRLKGSPREVDSPFLREIRLLHHSLIQGQPFVNALDTLSRRINSPLISNFSDAIAISMARGTPVAILLKDHARTLRESHKRKLLERAGKAEVKMMVPIIFLLLPVSVLFALWPSFQQLQQLVISP